MKHTVHLEHTLKSRMRSDQKFCRQMDPSLGPAQALPHLVMKAGFFGGFRPDLDPNVGYASAIPLLNERGCGSDEFYTKFRLANRARFLISFDFNHECAFVDCVFMRGSSGVFSFRVRFGEDGKVSLVRDEESTRKLAHAREN